jgi:hypothetical protein
VTKRRWTAFRSPSSPASSPGSSAPTAPGSPPPCVRVGGTARAGEGHGGTSLCRYPRPAAQSSNRRYFACAGCTGHARWNPGRPVTLSHPADLRRGRPPGLLPCNRRRHQRCPAPGRTSSQVGPSTGCSHPASDSVRCACARISFATSTGRWTPGCGQAEAAVSAPARPKGSAAGGKRGTAEQPVAGFEGWLARDVSGNSPGFWRR